MKAASVEREKEAASLNTDGLTILLPSGRAQYLLADPARLTGLTVYSYAGWSAFKNAFQGLSDVAIVVTDAEDHSGDEIESRKLRSFIGSETVWIHLVDAEQPTQIRMALRAGGDDIIAYQSIFQERQVVIGDALKAYRLRSQAKERKDQEDGILRRQIQWLTYKESVRQLNHDTSGENAISSLSTSLSQGAGFGLMLSLVETIRMMASVNETEATIDSILLDQLVENARFARRTIEGFDEYLKTIQKPLQRRDMRPVDLHALFRDSFADLETAFAQRNMTLHISDNSSKRRLSVDVGMIEQAVEELLLNALKYSRAGSEVSLLLSVQSGYCVLTVQSYPEEYGQFTLEADLERLKLPFFRHHPPVEDIFEKERFVMGLGLSAVEHIAVRHEGALMLEAGVDHSGANVESCFLARLLLPLDTFSEGKK